MNEKINIASLLKDAPTGLKLYSPLFGGVEFVETNCIDGFIRVLVPQSRRMVFYGDGRYFDYPDAECLLFPSKEVRTWEGWSLPKHYDIKNFKPFDKVLVRAGIDEIWEASFFSHFDDDEPKWKYKCVGNDWVQCIPYEGNEHLLGTSKPCDECYVNW